MPATDRHHGNGATTTLGAPTLEQRPAGAQLHTSGHKSTTIQPSGIRAGPTSDLRFFRCTSCWRYHEFDHSPKNDGIANAFTPANQHINRALRARTVEQKLDEIALAIAELAKYVEDIEKDMSNSSAR